MRALARGPESEYRRYSDLCKVVFKRRMYNPAVKINRFNLVLRSNRLYLIWGVLLLSIPYLHAADKFKIQVTETSSMTTTTNGRLSSLAIFAKVILPNGDHASLMCGKKNCALIKPQVPEKMSPDATDCFHLGDQFTCTTHDLGEYWATRKDNFLTIEAPNGKLTFEIVGSW
jgi:hypothetical protein